MSFGPGFSEEKIYFYFCQSEIRIAHDLYEMRIYVNDLIYIIGNKSRIIQTCSFRGDFKVSAIQNQDFPIAAMSFAGLK